MTALWVILSIVGAAAICAIRDFQNPALVLILGIAFLLGLLPVIGAIAAGLVVLIAVIGLVACVIGEPFPW